MSDEWNFRNMLYHLDSQIAFAKALARRDVVERFSVELTNERIQEILTRVKDLADVALQLATPRKIEFNVLGVSTKYPVSHWDEMGYGGYEPVDGKPVLAADNDESWMSSSDYCPNQSP